MVVSRDLSEWGNLSSWNPTYLVARIGDRPVHVNLSETGVMYCHPSRAKPLERVWLPFRQAATAICSPQPGKSVYLMQQSIDQDVPELAQDIRAPRLLGSEPASAHLWFGSAGTVTPLHYDPLNNLFLQVYGRKRFTIYSPWHFEEMYPLPPDAPFSHVSPVDAERLDMTRHPRFAEAHGCEVTLEPGDLLYLPPFWWHHVRSLDISISLSFWWAPELEHCLVPAGLRLLMTLYRHDRLRSMGRPFGGGPGGFLESARRVHELGLRWPAVLLAGAALEQPVRRLCSDHGVRESEGGALRDLAAINGDLARAGVYASGVAEAVASLAPVFTRALACSEDLFTGEEVACILSAVESLTRGS